MEEGIGIPTLVCRDDIRFYRERMSGLETNLTAVSLKPPDLNLTLDPKIGQKSKV